VKVGAFPPEPRERFAELDDPLELLLPRCAETCVVEILRAAFLVDADRLQRRVSPRAIRTSRQAGGMRSLRIRARVFSSVTGKAWTADS
jgi:hypothetical protein